MSKLVEKQNKSTDSKPAADDTRRVKIWAFMATVLIVIMGCVSIVCAQVMGGAVPNFEMNACRFGLNTIVASLILMCRRISPRVSWSSVWTLSGIGVAYAIYYFSYYAAAIYFPVATLGGTHLTIGLITNCVLAVFIKSKRSVLLLISSAVAIVGIALMIQPPFLFPQLLPPAAVNWTSPCVTSINATDLAPSNTRGPPWLGYVYVMLSGSSLVLGNHMTQHSVLVNHVEPIVISFWMGVFGSSLSIVCSVITEEMRLTSGLLCTGLLFLHVVGTLAAAIGAPCVLQYLSATVYAMLKCSRLPILLILQYSLLSSVMPGNLNWIEVVGAALCFTGSFLGPLVKLIRGDSSKPDKLA